MGDDVSAKEERFRMRVQPGPMSVHAKVGDGNPGSLVLSLRGNILAEAPEIPERYIGTGEELRGQVLRLEGLVRKDRPGAQAVSIWLWVKAGEGADREFCTSLEVADHGLASLALNLRFL